MIVKDLVIMQIRSAVQYLPAGCLYALGISGAALILCAVWRSCLHRKLPGILWWRLAVGFLFVTYMYCVLQLTIFSRERGDYGGVDWRFLARWNENDAQKAFLIANIIMFIPFGILLPMFGKILQHILIATSIALVSSVSIEAVQLKYQLGFCQLDDVVANSVGFLTGFCVFLVLRDILIFAAWALRPVYLLQLYKALHPEDGTVTEDEISDYVPALSLEELREPETEIMQLSQMDVKDLDIKI